MGSRSAPNSPLPIFRVVPVTAALFSPARASDSRQVTAVHGTVTHVIRRACSAVGSVLGSSSISLQFGRGTGMTPGTSPHPRGMPSIHWTAAEHGIRGLRTRLPASVASLRIRTTGPLVARLTAVLYLAGLAILAMTAWHDPAAAANGLLGGLPGWHLAFLMATGTGVAVLTLTKPEAGATTTRTGGGA